MHLTEGSINFRTKFTIGNRYNFASRNVTEELSHFATVWELTIANGTSVSIANEFYRNISAGSLVPNDKEPVSHFLDLQEIILLILIKSMYLFVIFPDYWKSSSGFLSKIQEGQKLLS